MVRQEAAGLLGPQRTAAVRRDRVLEALVSSPTSVEVDPYARLNAGGWCRPASDVLFAGSNATGSDIPGTFLNRTNGDDVGTETYSATGYAIYGTEGTSQPFSFHPNGLNVTLGDGAVKFIDDTINIGVVAALVTRNTAGGSDTDDSGVVEPDELFEPVVEQNF